MSHGVESKESVKRRNARPDRKAQRQAQGNMYMKNHPEKAKEYKEKTNARKLGTYAQMLDDMRNPIVITETNVAITCDWHIPFCDEELVEDLIEAAQKNETKTLIIAGDFWDCDDFSKFTHLNPPACFTEETEHVKMYLRKLLRVFEQIYICRGNHEKRWIDINSGKMGMKELFALARPSNMSEDDWNERVHITTDDHIHMDQNGQRWLICHPRNYRQVELSVARDLAAKHQCHIIAAHGHRLAQGRDRSGAFRIMDGGGMFEQAALSYLRDTSTHPMTRTGFYLIKDNQVTTYEGRTLDTVTFEYH